MSVHTKFGEIIILSMYYNMQKLPYSIIDEISTFMEYDYITFVPVCTEFRDAWRHKKETRLIIYKNTTLKYFRYCIDSGFGIECLYDFISLKACENGNLEILKYLFSIGNLRINIRDVYISAAENGHLEILKWIADPKNRIRCIKKLPFGVIYEKDVDPSNSIYSVWSYTIFNSAVKNGHINILEWLRDPKSRGNGSICPWNKYACIYAAKYDQLEVLKWLRDPSVRIDGSICDWDHRVCSIACENGNLEILKWLRDPNARSDGSVCEWYKRDCILYGVANNHNDLVDWVNNYLD